jgi:uracil-DNA glycosylase
MIYIDGHRIMPPHRSDNRAMTNDDAQFDLFGLGTDTPATVPANFNPELIPTDAQVPIPPGTYSDMAEIRAHCSRCDRCGLGATRTNAVIFRGNPQAKLMIIGEGPGQNEDETGLPFVGKAGQLLDKILGAVNLTENEVVIVNIVKCRPPDNRAPTDEEMKACTPYLQEQIRMVDPKIILLVGATAVKGLTGDKRGITKIRGQWMEWEGRWCMPMFHPAYLLRNQSKEKGSPKWLTWQDIQTVKTKWLELVEST